jgi:spore germination cell wall hydrolase CwlJ-like protein
VKLSQQRQRFIARLTLLAGMLLLAMMSIFLGYIVVTGNIPSLGMSDPNEVANQTGRPNERPTAIPKPPENINKDIAPEKAIEINNRVPFAEKGLEPVSGFKIAGNPTDLNRAANCLALAGYYEAGDDIVGQAAVLQVVLNRVRHPAFPKTVCGVVFQGSERKTGCQFSFTCDGSMNRRKPSAPAWNRALGVANAALSGYVFRAVGAATHYHTDWIVAYWDASMEKIAKVGTHIFYRWPGYYGKAKVLASAYAGGEILTPDAQAASDEVLTNMPQEAHGDTITSDPMLAHRADVQGVNAVDLQGNIVRLSNPDAGQFVIRLEPSAYPGSYAILAHKICAQKPSCEVWGWTNSTQMPTSLPPSAQSLTNASFHFVQNAQHATGQAQWNCKEFTDRKAEQCLTLK